MAKLELKKTAVTNLYLANNGRYYLKAKIQGKQIWKSFGKDVSFTTAKLRLPDMLKEFQAEAPAKDIPQASVEITFREVVEIYRRQVETNTRLKDTTKQFRMRSEITLQRTWPEVFDMQLRKIKAEHLEKFMTRFESGGSVYTLPRAKGAKLKGDSPTTINALIGFLRHIFKVGIKSGIMSSNPAAVLKRKPLKKKLLRLPSKEKFREMVATVRASPGWGRVAGDLMEGLAYSGMRVGESRLLLWEHIDYDRGMFTVPGEKTASSARIIPMLPAFQELTLRIKAHKNYKQDDRVFQANVCQESLKRACKHVGTQHMTHHDLRHLFATTCIEAGVDIPTVASWLGHKDGGALAMKTYGHIRPAHSTEAAKKVKF